MVEDTEEVVNTSSKPSTIQEGKHESTERWGNGVQHEQVRAKWDWTSNVTNRQCQQRGLVSDNAQRSDRRQVEYFGGANRLGWHPHDSDGNTPSDPYGGTSEVETPAYLASLSRFFWRVDFLEVW